MYHSLHDVIFVTDCLIHNYCNRVARAVQSPATKEPTVMLRATWLGKQPVFLTGNRWSIKSHRYALVMLVCKQTHCCGITSVDTPGSKEHLLASCEWQGHGYAWTGREMERHQVRYRICARASTNCIPILGNGARSPFSFRLKVLWFPLARA